MTHVAMEPSTEVIRGKIRDWKTRERENSRFFAHNYKRRFLGETTDCTRVISAAEVLDLAAKLKNKKITINEFKLLKHAFIQSNENIKAFLGVTGAMHSIVRELSGHNTDFQLEAINCCCNLALGEGKAGLIVTKAAAPYLISQLSSFSDAFLDICVWTLGNLAGSGEKSWSILKSQGILSKLLQFISSSRVTQSSLYALTIFVSVGFNHLEASEFEAVAAEVCPLLMIEPNVHWLIYLITCNEVCDSILLSNSIVSKSLQFLSDLLHSSEQEVFETRIVSVTALLRVLGNLCAGKFGVMELLGTEESQRITVNLLNKLLTSSFEHIKSETLWLIANITVTLDEPMPFILRLEPNLSSAMNTASVGLQHSN